MKKKYTVTRPVTSATGNQYWTVEASSEKEAMKLVKEGKGVFLDEELEVTNLGDPEIVEVSDCDV